MSNLEKNITSLKLDKNVVDILNNNEITLIKELWTKNRKFLKNIGLSDKEIKNIIIKLELIGLDLGKRTNK